MNPPKDGPILILRTCKCTLTWQEEFAGVIKCKILRWGLIGVGVQGIKCTHKRDARRSEEEEGDIMTQVEVELTHCRWRKEPWTTEYCACFHWKPEQVNTMDSP